MILPILSESFASNTFIVIDDLSAIIDIGIDSSRLKKISENNITQYVFINTHCHYDHIGALLEVEEPIIWMHEADAEFLEKGDDNLILSNLFEKEIDGIHVKKKLKDGQSIKLGKTSLEVIHTPGHTPGSICLYEPRNKSLFSGDTVFVDGIGRTDFPGGSFEDLKRSVEKLLKLHDERGIEKLYPGHGPIGSGSDIEGIYKSYFER